MELRGLDWREPDGPEMLAKERELLGVRRPANAAAAAASGWGVCTTEGLAEDTFEEPCTVGSSSSSLSSHSSSAAQS